MEQQQQQQQKNMVLIPALVGAYAVAGLFIQRAMRGSSAPLQFEQVLLVGGTSAVAAAVTPYITSSFICPHKPLAPVVDASVSSGLVYGLMRLESVDMDGAAMFVPIQLLSTLLAHQVAKMMWESKSLEKENQQ
jgi:hypothetical protein